MPDKRVMHETFYVGQLSPKESVSLFMEKAGSAINVHDVHNFILNDEAYPIKELNIQGLTGIEPDMSQESKQKILNYLEQGRDFVSLALEKHKLF